jgi:FkbM family methyltransferase
MWFRRLSVRSSVAWLFSRGVLAQASEPEVAQQFPWPFRAAFWYCRQCLRWRGGAASPPGARLVFRLAVCTWRLGGGSPVRCIRIDGHPVCLLLRDLRFLAVIMEVEGHAPTAVLPHLLGPGDTFLDIGANQGGFSIVASRLVGARGMVVAVEPQPQLAEVVRRSLNKGAAPFLVHQVAVGDRDDSATLYVPNAYSGMASLFPQFAKRTGRALPLRVWTRRFDTLTEGHQLPGRVVLKIDVEGSEALFLRGAGKTVRRWRPVILLEVNLCSLAAALSSVRVLVDLLTALGYRTYRSLYDLRVEQGLESLEAELRSLRRRTECDILVFPSDGLWGARWGRGHAGRVGSRAKPAG